MAQNIIFILTEGDHDSAFLYRILKANGAKTDHQIIKNYPFPLNQFLVSGFPNISIEDLNIEAARSRFLTSYIMQYGNNTILLFSIGGDSKTNIRVELIKSINAYNIPDKDAFQTITDTSFSVLLFFDADSKGSSSRVEQVKNELAMVFTTISHLGFTKEIIYSMGGINVGTFVFTENGKDTGMLEDVLIPLMKLGNDDIFDAANEFLNIHEQTALFKGTLKMQGMVIKEVNGHKYSYRKSLIATVGQLQKSGKSNSICIRESDYLNELKILADTTCVSIFQFIQKAMIL